MFDVRAAVRQAEEFPESEGAPTAKPAKSANNTAKISDISNFSSISPANSENWHKLKSAKLLYGSSEIIPFTEEIINRRIDRLKMRDDRYFVRNQLKRIPSKDRLGVINQYFEEWRKGMDEQPDEIKKENAGRNRANTWLRTLKNRGF